jgi:sulfur relay protein TusB/DsrH
LTTLHIINRPIDRLGIDLLPLTNSTDGLLLIEDGVYCVPQTTLPIFGLFADMSARGMKPGGTVKLVDYAGFVGLCEQYNKVVTW